MHRLFLLTLVGLIFAVAPSQSRAAGTNLITLQLLPRNVAGCNPTFDPIASAMIPQTRSVDAAHGTIGSCFPDTTLPVIPVQAEGSCGYLVDPLSNTAQRQVRLYWTDRTGQKVEIQDCQPVPGAAPLPITPMTTDCPVVPDWTRHVSRAWTRNTVQGPDGQPKYVDDCHDSAASIDLPHQTVACPPLQVPYQTQDGTSSGTLTYQQAKVVIADPPGRSGIARTVLECQPVLPQPPAQGGGMGLTVTACPFGSTWSHDLPARTTYATHRFYDTVQNPADGTTFPRDVCPIPPPSPISIRSSCLAGRMMMRHSSLGRSGARWSGCQPVPAAIPRTV